MKRGSQKHFPKDLGEADINGGSFVADDIFSREECQERYNVAVERVVAQSNQLDPRRHGWRKGLTRLYCQDLVAKGRRVQHCQYDYLPKGHSLVYTFFTTRWEVNELGEYKMCPEAFGRDDWRYTPTQEIQQFAAKKHFQLSRSSIQRALDFFQRHGFIKIRSPYDPGMDQRDRHIQFQHDILARFHEQLPGKAPQLTQLPARRPNARKTNKANPVGPQDDTASNNLGEGKNGYWDQAEVDAAQAEKKAARKTENNVNPEPGLAVANQCNEGDLIESAYCVTGDTIYLTNNPSVASAVPSFGFAQGKTSSLSNTGSSIANEAIKASQDIESTGLAGRADLISLLGPEEKIGKPGKVGNSASDIPDRQAPAPLAFPAESDSPPNITTPASGCRSDSAPDCQPAEMVVGAPGNGSGQTQAPEEDLVSEAKIDIYTTVQVKKVIDRLNEVLHPDDDTVTPGTIRRIHALVTAPIGPKSLSDEDLEDLVDVLELHGQEHVINPGFTRDIAWWMKTAALDNFKFTFVGLGNVEITFRNVATIARFWPGLKKYIVKLKIESGHDRVLAAFENLRATMGDPADQTKEQWCNALGIDGALTDVRNHQKLRASDFGPRASHGFQPLALNTVPLGSERYPVEITTLSDENNRPAVGQRRVRLSHTEVLLDGAYWNDQNPPGTYAHLLSPIVRFLMVERCNDPDKFSPAETFGSKVGISLSASEIIPVIRADLIKWCRKHPMAFLVLARLWPNLAATCAFTPEELREIKTRARAILQRHACCQEMANYRFNGDQYFQSLC